MILILSGTNRKGSNTRKIAEYIYKSITDISSEEVKFLSLEDVSASINLANMYSGDDMPQALVDIQEEYVLPANKMIILSPEYNGSFAGVLKLFIDAMSMRKYAENFRGKSSALIGIASGRAGNLRGLEHLTGLLNYLGMHVHPSKLPISSIEKVLGDNDTPDESTQKAIMDLLNAYLK